MDTNENGSKLTTIIVTPIKQWGGSARPTLTFQDEKSAMEYAQKGDKLLGVFEDGSIYCSIRGTDSDIAEGFLYSGLQLDKQGVLDMCFHEYTKAAKAFVNSLVDYVIECHAEREAVL